MKIAREIEYGDGNCLKCKGEGYIPNRGGVDVCNYCNGVGKTLKASRVGGVGWENKGAGVQRFECSENISHVFYTDDAEVNVENVQFCPICQCSVSSTKLI